MSDALRAAQAFLGGQQLQFEDADALWRELESLDDIPLARRVLARLRSGEGLVDKVPAKRKVREELCRQEAKLTSKDAELGSAFRHDRALEILEEEFDLEDPDLDGDGETLGLAGGILKRRWNDLGQLGDLKRAADLYERGARGDLGEDAYAQINAAFLDDLLAAAGDDPEARRQRAARQRERILRDLPVLDHWWNRVTRAEALFGLRRYREAKEALIAGDPSQGRPEPWKLRTTTEQIATLAHLQEEQPLENPDVRAFFETLVPGGTSSVRSAFGGTVGLALSGGGFRASFYHLGVLARLAELDALRQIDVVSCVSGGSIVGACYWLALRRRLLQAPSMDRADYLELVRELIEHFETAVAGDLRGQIQPSKPRLVWRMAVKGEKGALDPEAAADALEKHFYGPLFPGYQPPLLMRQLGFQPVDHDPDVTGSDTFDPRRHNWLRANKVPELVLNATTVNTGHAWQFTPSGMGESPWSVHPAADSISQLEWLDYQEDAWDARLARAVASSACVPGVFSPLRITDAYEGGLDVHLVDGGVHDNQGTVSLLAQNCNVLLVSDAAGQLLLEERPQPGLVGLASYLGRSMSTLMARVRLANFADLEARKRSSLLRGLMFVHMKSGLDADVIRLRFSPRSYDLRRSPLTPYGIRKDFQEALASLRTDLDDFTPAESRALMACGYQMAKVAFERDLNHLGELWSEPAAGDWPFLEQLDAITSLGALSPERQTLLDELRAGSKVRA